MDSDQYSRNIELRCPTCTGTQFECDESIESAYVNVRCIGCDRTVTKEDLIRENLENINAHAAEIREEAVKDFAQEMKKSLQNAFRGNKNIKYK